MKHLALSIPAILTIGLALCLPAQGQSAGDLLQQGSRLEQVEGDYEGAIALYRQIAENQSADRRLVASALLQMGKAYEVLGRDGAREAYTRIVNEYGDFDSIASEAAERVAAFRRLADRRNPITKKHRFSTTSLDSYDELRSGSTALSPFGRYLAGMSGDWSIVQVDLETDEKKTLVEATWEELEDGTTVGGFAQTVRYSSDETEIAYGWEEDSRAYVKVVNVGTGSSRTVLDVNEYFAQYQDRSFEPEDSDVFVLDWKKDGSAILAYVSVVRRESAEGNFEIDHHQFFLMVPLDGSPPHVVARDGELDAWGWSGACLAGNDRYIMTSFGMGGRNGIMRIDVETGEQVPWRQNDEIHLFGTACPAEAGKVLYVSTHLSSPYLMAGDPEEVDPQEPDEPLISVASSSLSLIGYSEKADLLFDPPDNANLKLIAIDADPETATLLGKTTLLDGEVSRSARWDPSGTQFAWISGASVKIWDRTTGETRSLDIARPLGRHRWFPDGASIGFWGGSSPSELIFSSVDLETGEESEPIPVTGMWIYAIGPDGNSLLVGESITADCIERFDLSTRERTPFLCLENRAIGLTEYHDYSKYLFAIYDEFGTTHTIGVFDADRSNQRVVYETGDSSDSGNSNSWHQWSSPKHVAHGKRGRSAQKADSIIQVDIETGEVTPMYDSIFSEMVVNSFVVSPDGKTVIFYGKPLQQTESEDGLFILHNVLGENKEN